MSQTIDPELHTAFALHRSGDLANAANIYRQIIGRDSNNFCALQYLGILEASLGHIEQAKTLMARSIMIDPPNIQFIENYASILFQTNDYSSALQICQKGLQLDQANVSLLYVGAISKYKLHRFEDSIVQFDKLLSLEPTHIAAINERGSVLAEMGKYDAALASFEKALQLQPQYAEAWLNKANVLKKLSRHDQAAAAYDKALALKPGLHDAWLGRGNILRELRRYDEAFASYDKALSIKPDLEGVWLGRGNALSDLKRHDEALAAYDRAVSINADLAEAWLGRGNVLKDFQRYDEAFSSYDKALSIKPDLASAWLGRGNVLSDLKRYDEALAEYDKALSINPDLAEAWLGRGLALTDLTHYPEALAAFDTGILHAPHFADLYWGKAVLALTLGDFYNGWDLYEWRFQNSELYPHYYYSKALQNLNLKIRQDKKEFIGKSVTVLAEQGIGDEIMFTSILPDLMMDARKIYYECDKRLTELFERSFPKVTFIKRDDSQKPVSSPSDITIKAGSLAYSYRKERHAFPKTAYLKSDENRVRHWSEQLKRYSSSGMKVGISWRGGTSKTRASDRSIELDHFRPLIQLEGTLFVNLQYGNIQDEIDRFNKISMEKPIHRVLENMENFDELAALISSLDLVISVQNATVHLCGALGRPCWGLIPFRPEWRYGSMRQDMVWYPSIKLYRQTKSGDWNSVLQSVRNDLQGIARHHLND
jgi:tetratricopeptide (TPR) repeat protein